MHILICFIAGVSTLNGVAQAFNFTNPKSFNGSDPFLIFAEGYYWLTTSTWSNIQVTKASTLAGFRNGVTTVFWENTDPALGQNIWAPGTGSGSL